MLMDKLRGKIDFRQVITLGAIVLAFFLLMDLNSRLTELYAMKKAHSAAITEVYNLQITHEALQKGLAYATSDAAVEEWGRTERRLVRPGDTLFVPIPRGKVAQVKASPTPTPVPVQNEEVWKALFFGE